MLHQQGACSKAGKKKVGRQEGWQKGAKVQRFFGGMGSVTNIATTRGIGVLVIITLMLYLQQYATYIAVSRVFGGVKNGSNYYHIGVVLATI